VGFYARVWWLDALGGLILSIVVILNWSQTSLHHMRNLTGFSALPEERNLCRPPSLPPWYQKAQGADNKRRKN
jgi:hypothetical protein